MERGSSTEYSVVFLVESKKFKLVIIGLHLCCRFRAANSVGTTLEFAVFRSGPDPKYIRASATTMVFAAVRAHFLRKTTAFLVDGTAINRQPFKYNNEHVPLRSGRLVEWLGRSPTRAAGVRVHEGREGSLFIYSFPFFSFCFFYW